MLLELRCAGCETTIAVSRRNRGQNVPCPSCDESISVPADIDSRERVQAALADRRYGHRLYLITAFACVIWIPIVPAICLWLAGGRIHRTRNEGRPVPPPLILARLLAGTALVAQLAWIGLGSIDSTFMPLSMLYSW